MKVEEFYQKGWHRFEYDPTLAAWIAGALGEARSAVKSKKNANYLRCGGTWFVGVNGLPNNTAGEVGDSGPLAGTAVDYIHHSLGLTDFQWDRGQVSVCYPDYPQPMETESSAAFRYRCQRDAAHVDGLLREGADKRRHLREFHGFILGIPMTRCSRDASPFVVWEGSHEIVRQAFLVRFGTLPPPQWGDQDITDLYHQVRRTVFDQCTRVEVPAIPGQAYIVHRLSLHGMAPWSDSAVAGNDGRMICYFRPQIGGPAEWLNAP